MKRHTRLPDITPNPPHKNRGSLGCFRIWRLSTATGDGIKKHHFPLGASPRLESTTRGTPRVANAAV